MITENFYFSESIDISISRKMEINLCDTNVVRVGAVSSYDALDMGLFKVS
jgi:hypothetical protein